MPGRTMHDCVYVRMYVYMYVCIYVCVYICMCVYMYVSPYNYRSANDKLNWELATEKRLMSTRLRTHEDALFSESFKV